MNEGIVRVVPKEPLLGKDIAEKHGYEVNNALWSLKESHHTHGGSPVIVGVVTVNGSMKSRSIPRYKLMFPDGFIDYARIDNFDTFYTLVPELN
ncbi:hypothetical protein HUB98_05680 [Paenibacillus barcinonensis]|uniref:Uncharacterized protein n=1 Tax=Paenibacillus barcinonensis TaxID=198119 RepID=A0A2V4W046_PAEBA|nr:hypothetical protein [Paenibacillus barcinonensis]PYE51485.1 hypothetical protein DFQ00_102279 [Paenibacillus barcinonensis]QKS55870.1 hypothetical protein HUB98_05680 [Paenibacillus barcinonensis]